MITFANTEHPDEMQHNVAFHQSPHCKGKKDLQTIKNAIIFENYNLTPQGFPFKKIFRGHCDPQVVDFGGHFQFERVTY